MTRDSIGDHEIKFRIFLCQLTESIHRDKSHEGIYALMLWTMHALTFNITIGAAAAAARDGQIRIKLINIKYAIIETDKGFNNI